MYYILLFKSKNDFLTIIFLFMLQHFNIYIIFLKNHLKTVKYEKIKYEKKNKKIIKNTKKLVNMKTNDNLS